MSLSLYPTQRHVAITGAGGYIGARLMRRLLADPRWAECRFTLCDVAPIQSVDDRATIVQGDFGQPDVRDALLSDMPQIVFHLAGILGGAAEADYDLARRVNIDATLDLFEALRSSQSVTRVVFASSIAVFGPTTDRVIDDRTPPNPTLTYGAQKRMIEVLLEQFSARGWIDGLALRLPGIVARPQTSEGLKTAFLSAVFHDHAAGRDITLPVSAEGTTWLISASACVDALVHAAEIPSDRLDARRAMTLPAQRVSFGHLVAGLKRRHPESRSVVEFAPDPQIEAQFGRQPMLSTPLADGLGFRHDGDLDRLIDRALTPEPVA